MLPRRASAGGVFFLPRFLYLCGSLAYLTEIMKPIFVVWLALIAGYSLRAQNPDTTIYEVADAMPYPYVPACRAEAHPGWTPDSVRRCGEIALFSLLSKNVNYPEAARKENIQGTAVVSFIVEKDGQISQCKILKDIGGGCGQEAVRVINALNRAGFRWGPAQAKGKPVRMRQSLPIRFKLQEALPYYVSEEGDSIYTSFDTGADFKGGMEALSKFVLNNLVYPSEYKDSCKTGIIEMSVLVKADGGLTVLNNVDFNNLGMDFQWQAMRMAKQSTGQWIPARYQDKPVGTVVPLRALFKSGQPGCAAVNDRFDRAIILSDEGATLLEADKAEAALQKWTEALALQPNNTELLYYRGTTLLNLNRRDDACKDYNKIYTLLGITWFEPVRKLMCGW